VIVFGCAITEPEIYERCALPGLRRAAPEGSEIMAHQSTGSLLRNYNLVLDKASELDDVEAVVLLHQDAEIDEKGFADKLRAALSGPDVAVVGCVGAVGVRNLAWWEGAVTWASFTHRYSEFGGGEFPGLSWSYNGTPPFYELGEVDSIDGFVMGLSPWAVKNVRFDETLGLIHGYDFDYCCQVRAAGKKIVTADFKVIHHHDLNLLRHRDSWIEAHMRIAEKWSDSDLTSVGDKPSEGSWKQRARRAEAELGAQRLDSASARYQAEALMRAYNSVVHSKSWKASAPLRAPRRIVARLRGKPMGPSTDGQ
jgi:hypothetical protein